MQYIHCDAWSGAKCFTCIISFVPYKHSRGRYNCYSHQIDNNTEATEQIDTKVAPNDPTPGVHALCHPLPLANDCELDLLIL